MVKASSRISGHSKPDYYLWAFKVALKKSSVNIHIFFYISSLSELNFSASMAFFIIPFNRISKSILTHYYFGPLNALHIFKLQLGI